MAKSYKVLQIGLLSLALALLGSGPAPAQESASFSLDSGFLSAYSPPGEARNLVFLDEDTLAWDNDRSARSYALYRDLLSSLSGLTCGTCLATDIDGTTAEDPDLPAAASGYFYLVNVRNRLGEEGTKGHDSEGSERPNTSPCP